MDSSHERPQEAAGNYFQRTIGRRAYVLAKWAEPLVSGARWVPLAMLIGAAPFSLAFLLRREGHHIVSSVLLAWLVAGCARRDQWVKGMSLIAVAFLTHCVVVIWATQMWPDQTQAALPGAAEYWQKQIYWIETGEDPEYDPLVWLPNHAGLALATTVSSVFSLGIVTFERGFHEVDLMNYYTGRLMPISRNGTLALVLGWHIWSLLRGAAYVVLTYELISLGLQCWSGITVSTRWRRAWRWGVAVVLLVADGVTKYLLLGPVRDGLYENLI